MKQVAYSVEEMIASLREDADTATWHVGYLKAVVDQDVVSKKLSNSFSGYAVEAATVAVKQSLVMYCARAWDRPSEQNPLISLRSAIEHFRDADIMRESWKGWYPDESFHHLVERVERHHEDFVSRFDLIAADTSHGSLRVLRSEHYAHLVVGSFDRKRLEREGPIENATWNDLIRLTEETVKLVGDMGYFLDGQQNPYPKRIDRALRYCKEFWRIMPVLGDVENSNLS